MKTITLKQLLITLICSIGLYSSGTYLVKMSYIETLFDALNVMIFFTCFFPFLFVSFALLCKAFRTIYRFSYQ